MECKKVATHLNIPCLRTSPGSFAILQVGSIFGALKAKHFFEQDHDEVDDRADIAVGELTKKAEVCVSSFEIFETDGARDASTYWLKALGENSFISQSHSIVILILKSLNFFLNNLNSLCLRKLLFRVSRSNNPHHELN